MKKKKSKYIKRPLVVCCLSYVIGIIGGELQSRPLQFFSYFFIVTMLIIIVEMYYKFGFVITIFVLFGMISIIKNPILNQERIYTNLDGNTVKVEGRIIEASHYEFNSYYIVKADNIYIDNLMIDKYGFIKIKADKLIDEYQENDIVYVEGAVKSFGFQRNPGEFNERNYSLIRKITTNIKANKIDLIGHRDAYNYGLKIRNYYSKGFDKIMPSNESQIIKTMILGEGKNLDKDTRQLYTDAGIAHVLAISGLHVSIIVSLLMWSLNKLEINKLIGGIFLLILLWTYAYIVGFGISTTRAVIMSSIMIIGTLLEETPDSITSLAAAGLILLSYNSLYLWDIGFQLSFISVGSLILLTPYFNRLFRIPKNIRNILSPILAVTICTTPLVAFYYYKVPLIGLITNIILLPFVTIIVILGFMVLLVYPISSLLAKFIIGSSYYILKLIDIISKTAVKLPLANIKTGKISFHFILLYILFFIVLISYFNVLEDNKKIKKYLISFDIIIISLFIVYKITNKNLDVTFLDVGQGDCCIIVTPDKKTLLIDGGEEIKASTIDRFLKYKGIDKIDIAILSHPHMDHMGGLAQIIKMYKIDKFIFTKSNQTNSYFNELYDIIKIKDIDNYVIKSGDTIIGKSWSIKCLYPFNINNSLSGNDVSAVLEFRHLGLSYYLTGDIEKEYEKEIISSVESNSINIIKVPHHGSKTSSSIEFIDAISPNIAVVSCGENNRYNHPSKEVIDRYLDKGITTLITKDSGAINIVSNKRNINVFKMEDKRMLWR